jgi:NADH dehydrogenase
MKIAITGGTGFVGGHLAESLANEGHEVVVVARGVDRRERARRILDLPGVQVAQAGVSDREGLERAFAGCEAVAHCAGINREVGAQTYAAVHVRGTENVVAAAERAGVKRLALISFLRARPACGSPYHESKWRAEELVRASALEWTVLKPGMVYGRGDHFLDHLSHALYTFPVYVGIGARRIRPLWIEDFVAVLRAALVGGHLTRRTVAVTGPTEIGFDAAVRRIAAVVGRQPLILRMPMGFHRALALCTEAVMRTPLLSRAQARMLAEEIVEPVLAPDALPEDLVPRTPFDERAIRKGLPAPGRFRVDELRLCRHSTRGID